ncbi:serine hydrolase domain-containing protein [Algoriphagus sp. D3-2-R+10]|uniref:serine hydrolase domain-containing protein n=1 Tax=Algoriphagus aurantiacus TaxID=3103948 RepID=UPI002B3930B7|nr:serine hydrolase domain-containing protein [Algoriphagus sp. D3-2-R+10]MEB2777351.1 serine hydrolase domain-containing protein [Algoriphagus sp. D3-2-R+10]
MKKLNKKRNRYLVLGFIILTSNLLSGWTTAPIKGPIDQNSKSSDEEKKIDQLFEQMNLQVSPGASVVVVKEQKVVFSKGYGLANLEYDIPISANTKFNVASISKQFTAFSIALLESREQLSFEDDIRQYLPEFPDLGYKISIGHLIHHTSGLRDQWELLKLAGWRPDDVITEDQLLTIIYSQKALNFEPGSEFQYSNTNYTLLAKIVEVITKKKFTKWTSENIFSPLGMNNTFFCDDYKMIVKNKALSYATQKEGYQKEILSNSTVGATNLLTTAEDLALWVKNFETIEVGNQSIINNIHKAGILNSGKKTDYAFGLGISTYKGRVLIYHPGSDGGYKSYIGRFPNDNLSVIVLSNLGSFNPEKTAMQIADIYLSSTDDLQLNLEEFEGRYEIKKGFVLNIWTSENQLKAQIFGKNDVHDVNPMEDSIFEIPSLESIIIFNRNASGQIDQLTIKKDGVEMIAPKLVKAETQYEQETIVTPEANMREYIGTYEIKKALAIMINLQGNFLKATITGKKENHDLIPITVSEFEIPTLNSRISFESDSLGQVYRLILKKDGKTMEAPKTSLVNSKQADLKEYAGTYYSDELNVYYSFVLDSGVLLAKHQRKSDITLKIISPDFLKGEDPFRDIEVVRDPSQNIAGIKVTSGLVRELWLEKVK